MNKRIISQEEYNQLVLNICNKIEQDSWRPDYIVGITRGGLLPAVMISHKLDIDCHAVKVSLTNGENCDHNAWMAEDAADGVNILVVDDINDSGRTLNWLVNDWFELAGYNDEYPTYQEYAQRIWNKNVRVATVINNLASQVSIDIDYAGLDIDKSQDPSWIVFPYENFWLDQQ